MKSTFKIFLIVACFFIVGCARKVQPAPRAEIVVISQPAEVPPGVVAMCWEEPIVKVETQAPGIDEDGKWYHPYYKSVREVRQGRWRPCSEVVSETKDNR